MSSHSPMCRCVIRNITIFATISKTSFRRFVVYSNNMLPMSYNIASVKII